MKCPKCDAETEENITKCPYCNTIIKDEYEQHKNNSNTNETGCLIGVLILVLIIFVPMIVSPIIQQFDISNSEKHEAKLIEEGKVKSADTVINEFTQIIKNREKEKVKNYLTNDFTYIDNNRYETKYIEDYNFWNDLKLLTSTYDIEKRGNSIKDEATYRIYWNVVGNNKNEDRASRYYCLQKLDIFLRKVVEEEQIIYKIYKIRLTNNT